MGSNVITPGQRLASALAANVTEERLATAIGDALTATQANRDGTVTPDHKTRLQAASLGLAYSHGRPIERVESINVNLDPDSQLGIEERLADSPALRQALRKTLDKCDSAD